MFFWQKDVHGRGLRVGRSEVRSSSGSAKCDLCRTTQWWGPPTLRGSQRSPSVYICMFIYYYTPLPFHLATRQQAIKQATTSNKHF